MKAYRAMLLIAAGMLFISTIAALSLPANFYLALRIIVTGIAVYSALYYRNYSWVAVIGLLLIAFVFNPFVPVELPEPTGRILALAAAAGFIRLGFKVKPLSGEA